MATSNKELTAQAREALKGKWGTAVGAFIIYIVIIICITTFSYSWDLITGAFSMDTLTKFSPVSTACALIIKGPFSLGIAIFILAIARRNEDAQIEQIFWGFKSFIKAFFTGLLLHIFILLWTLLLIIPGIIAMLAYSMTFFILAEDKTIKPFEAIRKSREMMNGYKWKYFCLNLRFIGWILLCYLTLGIGLFWVMPYMEVSFAKFYEDIKADYIAKNPETITAE